MSKFIRNLLLFSPLIFFAYTPWTLYPAIFGRSVIFQILIEVILLLLIIRSLRSASWRRSNPINEIISSSSTPRNDSLYLRTKQIFYYPIGISLSIFTLIQFVSYFFSVDREQSFWGSMSRMDGIFSWLHMVAFYFLLVLFFSGKKESEAPEALRARSALQAQSATPWIKFLWINTIIASILSILAIIQHYHDLIPKYIIQSGRVYATFGNPVFFAPYLLFSIFFTVLLIIELRIFTNITNRIWGGCFLVLSLFLQIVALFWTSSQGAIGGFLVGVLVAGLIVFTRVILVNKDDPCKTWIYRTALIGLLGLTVFVGFSKLDLNQFIKSPQISKIEGLESRLTAWKMGLQGSRERPIFGFGPSTFEYVFDKYYDPTLLKHSFYETVSNKPHNILIETLTHTGLAGLLSYLGIFFAAILSLWKYRSGIMHHPAEVQVAPEAPRALRAQPVSRAQHSLLAINLGLLVAYFLSLQFSFDTTNTWYMFMVFLAYLTDATRKTRMHANDSNSRYEITRQARDGGRRCQFIFMFSCSSVLVIAAALWFGNIEAWMASVPAAKSENKYWLEKPIKWADEVKYAAGKRSPYHDEIRVILAQDLIKWEALGSLPMEEIQEQTSALIYELESSAEKHPNNFQYLFTLAQIQGIWAESFDLRKFDGAIQSVKQALQNSLRRQGGYLVLGKLFLQKGDLAAATDVADKAIDLYKQAPEPHWFLGIIKSAKGELDEAVKEFILARDLGYDFKPQEIQYWIGVNKKRGKELENEELRKLLVY